MALIMSVIVRTVQRLQRVASSGSIPSMSIINYLVAQVNRELSWSLRGKVRVASVLIT